MKKTNNVNGIYINNDIESIKQAEKGLMLAIPLDISEVVPLIQPSKYQLIH